MLRLPLKLFLCLPAALFIFLFSLPAQATFHKSPRVCNNVYALCNAAACYQIPGAEKKVFCKCSIWKGKNVGYSSCSKRKPRKNSIGRMRLVSTFAFGGGHYKTNVCPSGTPWATCLDQPCIRSATNPRRAFCTCKIVRNTPYLTLATRCNKSNCSRFIWSGASVKGNTALVNALVKGSGLKKSPLQACKSS